MKPCHAARRAQGGYILLTVLGLLVVLVMLAGAAATTADRVRSDQQRDDQRLTGELAAHSTRATVLYMLATQRMTFAGLTVDNRIVYTPSELVAKEHGEDIRPLTPVGNELRMDGSIYGGLNGTRFALQPDNATFNINLKPEMRQTWFIGMHATPGEQARLTDALLDFQDPDDEMRLDGAEADQYRHLDRAVPPNRTLFTPLELRRVLGWGKLLASVDNEDLLRTITVGPGGRIDVNAAPVSVLMLLPGVTRAMAQRVVALRNLEALTDIETAYSLLPTLNEESQQITLYPSPSGILTVWPDASNDGTLIHFTLTPFDDGGSPWHIDYAIRLPARQDSADAPVRQPGTPLLGNPQAAEPQRPDAPAGG